MLIVSFTVQLLELGHLEAIRTLLEKKAEILIFFLNKPIVSKNTNNTLLTTY